MSKQCKLLVRQKTVYNRHKRQFTISLPESKESSQNKKSSYENCVCEYVLVQVCMCDNINTYGIERLPLHAVLPALCSQQ